MDTLPADHLQAAWERHAEDFIAWARKPNHDSYWQFHRDLFLPLVPAPGRRTLDLGCGEGRVSRDLQALGHRVVGLDASRTLIAAARASTLDAALARANAATLPFASDAFDCVIAFNSLQDIDDFTSTIREIYRVLMPGGRFCLALPHPINSAGHFESSDADSRFMIDGSYLDPFYLADKRTRDGLTMTFVSVHRPLSMYTETLADAGFLIEQLREPAVPEYAVTSPSASRWCRVPLFLHLRAMKLGG